MRIVSCHCQAPHSPTNSHENVWNHFIHILTLLLCSLAPLFRAILVLVRRSFSCAPPIRIARRWYSFVQYQALMSSILITLTAFLENLVFFPSSLFSMLLLLVFYEIVWVFFLLHPTIVFITLGLIGNI